MKKSKAAAILGFFLLSFTLLLTIVDTFCFDRSFYAKEYSANSTTAATGLTESGLNEATDVLLDYLKDGRDTLDLQLPVNGEIREVFDSREKAHMVDVKVLYQRALMVRNLTAAAGVILVAAAVIGAKADRLRTAHTGFQFGVMILFGIVAAILIYALMDFYTFWTNFHLMFFDNDLWLLDPNTEILINMVPEPFFYHLVLRIVIWFLGILVAVEGIFLFLRKKVQE